MAEKTFGAAIGFLNQTGYGVYKDTLNDITTSWPASNGLVLGDPGSGIGESWLSLSLNRVSLERPDFSGSYTKQVSSFQRTEVGSFTFTFPFCGNRADVSDPTPLDAEFLPIAGMDAMLKGTGLQPSNHPSVAGKRYEPRAIAGIVPISALLFISGNRYQCQDCFVSSLAIDYTPGQIALATATVEVGSVTWTADDVPATLTYGEQATVSAPMVATSAFISGTARSYNQLTLTTGLELERVPDSNSATGERLRPTGRFTNVSGTMRVETSVSDDFDRLQLEADDLATVVSMSWRVGNAAAAGTPALKHELILDNMNFQSSAPDKSGNVAVTNVEAKGVRGGSSDEIRLDFT